MGEVMEVLEIECDKCHWFNVLFISELKLNKSFTCGSNGSTRDRV